MSDSALKVRFHHIQLVTRSPAEPVRRLLRDLSTGSINAKQVLATIELDLAVQPGPRPPHAGQLLVGGAGVHAWWRDGKILCSDGSSWVEIGRQGAVLTGALDENAVSARPAESVVHVALLIALRELRVYELHSAAVATTDLGIVLVGASGSGKSTTCAALVSAGCRYLGDDRILLRSVGDVFELLAYPAPFRFTAQALAAFPALQPHCEPHARANGKYSVDVRGAYPERFLASWASRTALLFPTPAYQTRLVRMGADEALGGLLTQSGSLALEPHPTVREHLDALGRLASTPSYRLELGPEWLQDPAGAAQRLLARLEA